MIQFIEKLESKSIPTGAENTQGTTVSEAILEEACRVLVKVLEPHTHESLGTATKQNIIDEFRAGLV